jgi:hypothetical protein
MPLFLKKHSFFIFRLIVIKLTITLLRKYQNPNLNHWIYFLEHPHESAIRPPALGMGNYLCS